MPPWDSLLHSAKFGIAAVLGAGLGLFLGWPNDVVAGPGGQFDIDYRNRLGITSPNHSTAYWLAFFCAAGGGFVGSAVGAILVKLGMVRDEDLKIEQ